MIMQTKSRNTNLFLLGALLLFSLLVTLQADEEKYDIHLNRTLDFSLQNESYALFKSEIIPLGSSVNSFILSIDSNKGDKSVIHSYIRWKSFSKKTMKTSWGRFQPFNSEFHFTAIDEEISHVQLLFTLFDPKSTNTTDVKGFSFQGKTIDQKTWDLFMEESPVKESVLKAQFTPWPKPQVVSRANWGARPPKSEYNLHTPKKIVLHHSYIPSQSNYHGSSTIRGIQNYHMDNSATGWMDIGYHFLIGPDGKIYQGRPETAVGAHAVPNSTMVGICLIGDYDFNKDTLNPKMEKALVNLLSWLSSTYGIHPDLYYGHRDFSPKSCPGDTAYARLPTYAELVLKNIDNRNRAILR